MTWATPNTGWMLSSSSLAQNKNASSAGSAMLLLPVWVRPFALALKALAGLEAPYWAVVKRRG
ncbi:hypothetical protein SAMN00790413_01038 [Deinococcus hopiensis KR-140]|uniref:Uncharacterized protein n=1 Tax=Deinococcus hopiensis KR-140 TaxID=695939 RepID=A0A1W1VCV0_9DEIO|nr:hypothetical protein SAMN00790413_01038 [Deinococcus hopiensis KR-140]